MNVVLTRWTQDPTMAIEEAAANCYDSKPSPDGKIMAHCIESGHTAVTEFACFTWHISGVSRDLMAQLTRHRHSSFAIRSQRYVDERNFGVVEPDTIAQSKHHDRWLQVCGIIREFYADMVDDGIPKEDARYILPGGCETILECNMNFRELMQFSNLRLCTRAQWEIRRMTKKMVKEVIKVMPEAGKYLKPKCEMFAIPFCTEKKSCKKHPKLVDLIKGV